MLDILPSGSYRQAFLKATFVGSIVLAASLMNFLSEGRYPLLSQEVAMLLACLLIASVVVGMIYAGSPRRIQFALECLLLLIALTLNFPAKVVFVSFILTILIFKRHLLLIIGTVSAVVVLSAILFTSTFTLDPRSRETRSAPQHETRSLRPIVHIILDEHLGLQGLMQFKDTQAIGSQLRSFYLRNGFYVSGGAYSDYFYTSDSIPSLLNFGEAQPWIDGNRPVPRNRYFDLLKSTGYEITVFQTPYMDFCAHPAVSNCWTHPDTMLQTIRLSDVSPISKAAMLTREFSSLSFIGRILLDYLDSDRRFQGLPGGVGALAALEEVSRWASRPGNGSALFVHVLAPHFPYIFDRNCKLKNMKLWLGCVDKVPAPEAC